MNLVRVLNVALPELPARTVAERYPRLDPGVSHREHVEDGRPVVRIYVPSCAGMYTFASQHWRLAQLFDGKRSYAEIAEIYSQQNNVQYDAEEVRKFADELEANEFWYKTPQEKNILLMKQSVEERRKKVQLRSKWADLSDVTFPAFNPDRFLTWFYGHTKFIYTTWFTLLTLVGFALCAGLTITHWEEIRRDTALFYTFANKTWADVFALYTLGMFVVAVHEFAHAHACKHFGGRVPAMGFALVYLTPAFYTDTTEGFVQGSRWQRFTIAMAGIWAELILCSIATLIWVDTAPGTLVHDGAHFMMMMTGMMAVLVNWNPLMKLDGYYMLCEVVGIRDLKEDSTAYVSNWVKRHIWRLPVEVPYVPNRRRLGFAAYAILSGVYSYTVLYILARFAGNFVRNFSPEWGFVPEIAVALVIFRSRIRSLGNFMKLLYLDKKDRVAEWFTMKRSAALACSLALILFIPLWHESVTGRFTFEPLQQAVVRVHVPGTVTGIDVQEGEQVREGQLLASLSNLPFTSKVDETDARLMLARERLNSAELRHVDYGMALKEQEEVAAQAHELAEMKEAMQVVSPLSGMVVSPRVRDLVGTYVKPGDQLMEVADLRVLRARIYLSEWDMSKVHVGAGARLQVRGFLKKWAGDVASMSAEPTEAGAGLASGSEGKESKPQHFYVLDLQAPNGGLTLRPGMTGVARIYGKRRSLAGMGWEAVTNFWGRKLW
jgi:putative peptide zinc metalloprotease protein